MTLTCALHSGVDPNVSAFIQMYIDQTRYVANTIILIITVMIRAIAVVI